MKLRTYTKEFGTNLRLAYPVIVGMLGHTVVQLIDNILVGQLGTAELAAVSLGNSFVFVAMSLGIGFSLIDLIKCIHLGVMMDEIPLGIGFQTCQNQCTSFEQVHICATSASFK